ASTIPLATLQRAFQNIYDTMDSIDTFKLKALDSMKQTVTTLSSEVEKSRGYIARAEGASQAAVSHDAPGLLSLEG
ncbi:MAG: toxic anion resistance protein, partial [Novosphingobium sp.]